MARLLVTLLAAAAAIPIVQADHCCNTLSSTTLRNRLVFPGQDAYEAREDTYFDVKQQAITPNCIAQPRNAKKVAIAIKTLTSTKSSRTCEFALRSAGHTPCAGASDIEDGVTLDLKYLNAVQYDAESTSVKVGPAASWNHVYEFLGPMGIMLPGGRSSTVGVGGLTLGGGISYFSPGRGLVCDNVVEFEVVLANGHVVTVSKTLHPDLFTVLKGGNNNFGIVTSFTFGTFQHDGMWGGLVIYQETNSQDHFKALINFSNNIDTENKGSAIVMPVYQSSAGADLILHAYDYAEPVPRPAAFDEFLAVPGSISETTGIRNMSSLAAELAGVTAHSVYFGTLIFANDLRFMNKAHEIYMRSCGNVQGLERFGGEVLCLYQPYISWQGAEQDELFQTAGANLVNRIREYAESIGADNPYLYLICADITQDPLASYGPENVKNMKAEAKKYDPFGVFQKLVPGGFKISKVD